MSRVAKGASSRAAGRQKPERPRRVLAIKIEAVVECAAVCLFGGIGGIKICNAGDIEIGVLWLVVSLLAAAVSLSLKLVFLHFSTSSRPHTQRKTENRRNFDDMP